MAFSETIKEKLLINQNAPDFSTGLKPLFPMNMSFNSGKMQKNRKFTASNNMENKKGFKRKKPFPLWKGKAQ